MLIERASTPRLSSGGAAYKVRKQYIAPLELYRIRRFSYLYFTSPGLFFQKTTLLPIHNAPDFFYKPGCGNGFSNKV